MYFIVRQLSVCVICCRHFPGLSTSSHTSTTLSGRSDSVTNLPILISSPSQDNERRQDIQPPASSEQQSLTEMEKKLKRIAAESRATGEMVRRGLEVPLSPSSTERNETLDVFQTVGSVEKNHTEPRLIFSSAESMQKTGNSELQLNNRSSLEAANSNNSVTGGDTDSERKPENVDSNFNTAGSQNKSTVRPAGVGPADTGRSNSKNTIQNDDGTARNMMRENRRGNMLAPLPNNVNIVNDGSTTASKDKDGAGDKFPNQVNSSSYANETLVDVSKNMSASATVANEESILVDSSRDAPKVSGSEGETKQTDVTTTTHGNKAVNNTSDTKTETVPTMVKDKDPGKDQGTSTADVGKPRDLSQNETRIVESKLEPRVMEDNRPRTSSNDKPLEHGGAENTQREISLDEDGQRRLQFRVSVSRHVLVWWDWPFTWWTDQLLSFSA